MEALPAVCSPEGVAGSSHHGHETKHAGVISWPDAAPRARWGIRGHTGLLGPQAERASGDAAPRACRPKDK